MIGRLLGAIVVLVAAVCVATVLAETLAIGYLRYRGKLDEKTVVKLIAVANGADAPLPPSARARAENEPGPEQASLEDVARERALRSRDIELRELALGDNLAMVQTEYAKLIDEKDRYERIKTAFRGQLDELREGVLANNRDTARAILENMKPKQAKDQILRMVKYDEIDDVIKILSLMPTAKRAKIVGEFKTQEESETLAGILKRIREGVPEKDLVDQTEKALDQQDAAAN
ncbi:MAG: hypothetical protein B7Z73_04120 [Planctomycetia bacterium 21-64-5]|nr:MAG: hypothetical protein B7Z73_04120 [Planctomycetia bacterium 21-64-5]HQU42554.1 hypothetical protein [Pirellulales bacterium]